MSRLTINPPHVNSTPFAGDLDDLDLDTLDLSNEPLPGELDRYAIGYDPTTYDDASALWSMSIAELVAYLRDQRDTQATALEAAFAAGRRLGREEERVMAQAKAARHKAAEIAHGRGRPSEWSAFGTWPHRA